MAILSDYPIAPTLPATDIDRAKAFYRDVLGFTPVAEITATGEVIFSTGPGNLFIVYRSSWAGSNQATAAAWRVGDLRATVQALRAKGVRFEEYDLPGVPMDDAIAHMPDGTLVAWFKDTEGNILGIDQFPESYAFAHPA